MMSSGERERDGVEPTPILGIPLIPFDLFVSLKKKKKKMVLSDMRGNIVYYSTYNKAAAAGRGGGGGVVLYDSSSNPLFSILPLPFGTWKAYRGDASRSDQHPLFTVERTLNTFNQLNFNISLVTSSGDNLSFSMRGCLFWRTCTIYHHTSILAQTNLMYKLGFRKLFVSRSLFRLTLFPGFPDFNFIAALLLIFLDGRR